MIALEKSLAALTRRIRERENDLADFKREILGRCGEYMAEVLLQGQDLLKAKAQVPHGQWLPWLANHAHVSQQSASDYMRLASNHQRAGDFIEAGSIRKSLELLRLLPDASGQVGSGTATKESLPAYLDGLYRVSKVIKFCNLHPVTEWPEEGRENLREKLQPIAEALWPDRFK
jgi:hypothetical protein